MKRYDDIIIGFGKGGKTLAGALAGSGRRVALIEQSAQMYGGTCINVACIPSKSLEHSARMSAAQGGSFADRAARYAQAVAKKRRLTAALRQKNLAKLQSAGVEVILGRAAFTGPQTLSVALPDGGTQQLQGGHIFINTGAQPNLPAIPGLKESRYAYTSQTLMELDALPAELVIIGGGYIGLEFASYYQNFGARVTVVQNTGDFMPREDAEVAAAVRQSLQDRGVQLLFGAQVQRVEDGPDAATVYLQQAGERRALSAQAVLVAVGRHPNTEGLGCERAGVALTDRGAVQVDEQLRTTAPGVWAMGDVAGGLQFTYISLDDSRIVKSQLLGDGGRTTQNRGAVPYSVFLDPPMARVGLTEQEAKDRGLSVQVARLPVAAIPKAQVLDQTTGLFKVVIEAASGRILGAHLFGAEAHELINIFKLAIDIGVPYTVLRDNIYTHPTMAEGIGDLLAAVR
ncbi:Mercuric reductase [Anaerotruncus sp. 2789STDY5834896]|uniref:Mercuric reductase n=1 Tax=uncultured Anaerotruncus sp. TaxID=905011 RepID=A0A1C6GC36_9FIRM|nr:Mercuric reductase [uncultured Anaerotruncus sp.]